jgi:tetratricopeptide (TPR) repeat protein
MKTRYFHFICLLAALSSANCAIAQKQGQQCIDSLLDRIAIARPDTTRALLLSNLSFTYSTVNPTEGLKYGKRALELSKELNWSKGKASAYNAIGTNYQVMSDYGRAYDNFSRSLRVSEAAGLLRGVAVATGNIGVTYELQNNYGKAFEFENEALALYKQIKDTMGEARSLCNIGLVYMDVQEYDEAISYFTRAAKICKKVNNRKDYAVNTHNIGFAYRKMRQYEMAIEYSTKALKINEELNDNYGKAICLDNIGSAYLARKNYSKAMKNYLVGLDITRQINSRQREASILGKMGTCYLAMAKDKKTPTNNERMMVVSDDYLSPEGVENLNKAVKYLNESISLCKKVGAIEYLKEYSEALADAYALGGDYRDALESYKQYTTIRDAAALKQNKMLIKTASYTY